MFCCSTRSQRFHEKKKCVEYIQKGAAGFPIFSFWLYYGWLRHVLAMISAVFVLRKRKKAAASRTLDGLVPSPCPFGWESKEFLSFFYCYYIYYSVLLWCELCNILTRILVNCVIFWREFWKKEKTKLQPCLTFPLWVDENIAIVQLLNVSFEGIFSTQSRKKLLIKYY